MNVATVDQSELINGSRNRDGVTIENRTDQMGEIEYTTKRDLGIRIVYEDMMAALQRIHEGAFVPSSRRCSTGHDAAERNRLHSEDGGESLDNAA